MFWRRLLKVANVVLDVSDEFRRNGFFEVEGNGLLKVPVIQIGVQLLDVEFSELVDGLVSLVGVKVEKSWVRHLWVVRNGNALVEVGILWFVGGLEL